MKDRYAFQHIDSCAGCTWCGVYGPHTFQVERLGTDGVEFIVSTPHYWEVDRWTASGFEEVVSDFLAAPNYQEV